MLCEAIVNGTLAPGEQLHDGELCSWLGLSRTPVRDALARLEEEGLVETAPQRFTRVRPLHPQEARNLFPILATVHALATELAVPRLRAWHHQDLREANEAFVAALMVRDARRAEEADARFHGVFVAVAANPEIERLLARLTPRLDRMQRLHGATLPGRRSVAQHQAIIARAARGEAPAAASAARANWMTLGSVVEQGLALGGELRARRA
jgi:DNA-binding GntR family transcriptional regulator